MADGASEAGGSAAEPSIFGDSQPEAPAPQVVAASEHATHPFFAGQRSRGRGRGAGRGRGGGRGSAPAAASTNSNTALIVPDAEDRPQFTSISMRELEFQQRQNTDGAESSVFSDDDDEYERRPSRSKKHKKRRHAEARTSFNANDEDAMAAAAFGDGGEEDEDDEDEGESGEEGSRAAPESSTGGGARLLPIRGESCVGCICDRAVIDTVDKFVRQNAVCMTEAALYKAAALHYHNEIVIPRRREGVRVLPWGWKSIQSHYVLHVCDPLLQRAAAVRSLGAVRAVQEQSLMRINPDGSKQLDHKGAELLLKIVALQDKQIQALDAARMPPPPTGGARR